MSNVVGDVVDSATDAIQNRKLTVILTLVIQAWLLVGTIYFFVIQDWENFALTIVVILLTLVPTFLTRRYRVYIPPEFQLIAAAFVFLSLFLGSARDFYYKYWWWDMALHTSAGFLLGIVGWIAMFLLNETDRLPKGIRPAFTAVFAISFATLLGVLWEIFEFIVDTLWPNVNMMSHETGVRDTMHDLIVNLIGATIVGAMGWIYAHTKRFSFIVDAVDAFTKKNPRLFPKRKKKQAKTGRRGKRKSKSTAAK